MPIYKTKCPKCGKIEDVFYGKMVDGEIISLACKECGNPELLKIFSPIASANFSNSSSRKSLKTRTGVGELILKRGAKDVINKANQ
jgi:putative FmdB family regulatory protein